MKQEELLRDLEFIYNFVERNKNYNFECWSYNLKNFPENTCDICSDLIYWFFKKVHKINFKIKKYNLSEKDKKIFKKCKNISNEHVFLENEQYIVDITVNQFSENFKKIICTTEKSKYPFYSINNTEFSNHFFIDADWDCKEKYDLFLFKLIEEYKIFVNS